jgi:hypothetical protein
MSDRMIRDPMTLDEERRALLTVRDTTAHCFAIRDLTSPAALHLHKHHHRDGQDNDLLPTYAGAILGNDNER